MNCWHFLHSPMFYSRKSRMSNRNFARINFSLAASLFVLSRQLIVFTANAFDLPVICKYL